MSSHFTLTDPRALDDLKVLLARAARVEDGAARLIAERGILAVYVPVLHPAGILDQMPTVLGLRTFATGPEGFDAVVPVGELRHRLDRAGPAETDAGVPIDLPREATGAGWAAISPPRGGWTSHAPVDASVLATVARAGIDEVAAAVPTGTGEQIVHRVRSEVWGRAVPGAERVSAGGAFAAVALGFIVGAERVRVFETGPWIRLSAERGHVLIKRRGGLLA